MYRKYHDSLFNKRYSYRGKKYCNAPVPVYRCRPNPSFLFPIPHTFPAFLPYYTVYTVPLETIVTLDAVFPQWLDAVLLQIACSTTSKGMQLACSKDVPSFAAVNSGRGYGLEGYIMFNFVPGVIQLESNLSSFGKTCPFCNALRMLSSASLADLFEKQVFFTFLWQIWN